MLPSTGGQGGQGLHELEALARVEAKDARRKGSHSKRLPGVRSAVRGLLRDAESARSQVRLDATGLTAARKQSYSDGPHVAGGSGIKSSLLPLSEILGEAADGLQHGSDGALFAHAVIST